MPWSNTETVGPIDWSNRTTNSYYTFNLRTGVSVEMQVNLCNTLGADPWFNIPHEEIYEDLPVLIVDNWSDITKDLLSNTIEKFKNKIFKYEKLTLKYWVDKIYNYK